MLTIPETIKLFDSDAYAAEFTAAVLSAELIEKKKSSHWEIILDRTLFFPEEGGQTPDTGTIEGCPVIDVQLDGSVIRHSVKAEKTEDGQPPFAPGQTVSGQIDFAHRFSNMQNHSGEHILSGLIHTHFGLDNVGFHLGSEITMDFDGERLIMVDQLEEERYRAMLTCNFCVAVYDRSGLRYYGEYQSGLSANPDPNDYRYNCLTQEITVTWQ